MYPREIGFWGRLVPLRGSFFPDLPTAVINDLEAFESSLQDFLELIVSAVSRRSSTANSGVSLIVLPSGDFSLSVLCVLSACYILYRF